MKSLYQDKQCRVSPLKLALSHLFKNFPHFVVIHPVKVGIVNKAEVDAKKKKKNEDHGFRSHHFIANRWGNNGNSDKLYLLLFFPLVSKITSDGEKK